MKTYQTIFHRKLFRSGCTQGRERGGGVGLPFWNRWPNPIGKIPFFNHHHGIKLQGDNSISHRRFAETNQVWQPLRCKWFRTGKRICYVRLFPPPTPTPTSTPSRFNLPVRRRRKIGEKYHRNIIQSGKVHVTHFNLFIKLLRIQYARAMWVRGVGGGGGVRVLSDRLKIFPEANPITYHCNC